jgi:hypothetical protein
MVTLINAVVTIAPVAFVAIVAFPIACIGVRFAHVTEHANLNSLTRVVLAHQHMWRCCGFCERRHRPTIPMSDKNMWMLMVRWITPCRCFSFVTWPSSPAKTEPVLAPLAETVAADAEIVLAIVTSSTVVMKLVLYVVLSTALTCYLGLGVNDRRTQCCRGSLP